jgi:hypothetical protein
VIRFPEAVLVPANDALLSAQGAGFAHDPLMGLGELFARAKLLFRRRRPPAVEHAALMDPAQSSLPSEPSGSIH